MSDFTFYLDPTVFRAFGGPPEVSRTAVLVTGATSAVTERIGRSGNLWSEFRRHHHLGGEKIPAANRTRKYIDI